MTLKETRIGFIGCGKMGQAMIKGLVNSETMNGDSIMGFDVADWNWRELLDSWGVVPAESNRELGESCQILVLAVKPQYSAPALAEIKDYSADKLVISIVAGLTTETIQNSLDPTARVVRVMPNTPALVGEGASAVAKGSSATEEDLSLAREVMSSVGLVVTEKEENMDAVTGMSGSGPAFVFLFLEGLIGAGVRLGLSWDVAKTLAYQTVKGAAILAQESQMHVAQLRDDVTSPGGTSAAGLHVLEEAGLKAIMAKGIEAAAKQSERLGRINKEKNGQ